MFLQNIDWRHIVGALITGLVLHVAGFLNFWLFLALAALGIILYLIQYLPVGRKIATWLIMSWVTLFIVIPGAHRAIKGHWPLTAKALENQNRASDLKGAEIFHQPGLLGIAGQRNLANAKEKTREQLAQQWFAEAERLTKANDWAGATRAEKNGREILDQAIETRETDSEYIKEKLRSVKTPSGWWEKAKAFFTGTDASALFQAIQQGPLWAKLFWPGLFLAGIGVIFWLLPPARKWGSRLILVGAIIALLGGAGAIADIKSVDQVPGLGRSVARVKHAPHVSKAKQETRQVQLQPGTWTEAIYPPSATRRYHINAPDGTELTYSTGAKKKLPCDLSVKGAKWFKLRHPKGGEAVVVFDKV